MNLKPDYIEATKLRPVIANADRLACQSKHILKQIRLDFIVKALDFKGQFPSCLERRADANYAGALDDHRSHIQVKRLVAIGIQLFGYGKSLMRDALRINNNIGRKQILVRLAALARHLEVDSSLYQRTLDVAGRLVDLPITICVKIILPFSRVILCASRFLSALAESRQVGHWKPMLNQRCNALDTNTYSIHLGLLNINPLSCLPVMLSQERAFQNSGSMSAK